MTGTKKLFAPWLRPLLVIAQMLLTGGSVPHCHASVGHGGANGHAAPAARRPHRHWAGAGHSRHESGHPHGHSEPEADGGQGRSEPAEHDGDAIYLADAFGAAVAESRLLSLVTVWIARPRESTAVLPAAARHARVAVWPPGDRLPTLHDLLPHVLRT